MSYPTNTDRAAKPGMRAYPVGPGLAAFPRGLRAYGVTDLVTRLCARPPQPALRSYPAYSPASVLLSARKRLGATASSVVTAAESGNPLAIAATVASSLINVSSTAPQNEQDNAYMYNQGVTTKNKQWLVNLATVSGQAGQAAGIPGAGTPSATTPWRSGIGSMLLGGWGSASAQSDAVSKYQLLAPLLTGSVTSTLATLTASIVPGGMSMTTLVVLLGLGGAVLVATRKKRRRSR